MGLLYYKSALRSITVAMPLILAAVIVATGIMGCADAHNDLQEQPLQEQPLQEQNRTYQANEWDINEARDDIESDDEGGNENIKLTGYAQTYSDGFAWVMFSDDPDDSVGEYGCIDKMGKVKFVIPKNAAVMHPTPFEDGYSYLVFDWSNKLDETIIRAIGVLDENGNVTKFGPEQDVLIVAYGGGYTVLERHEADFNSNGYSYEIYDAHGTKVDEKQLDDQVSVIYCGEGVFEFQGADFYCSKTGKWVHESTNVAVDFIGDSDVALVADNYFDSDDIGYSRELVFMTSAGEISRYGSDDLPGIYKAKVSDGKCVLHDSHGNYYVYDLAVGSLKQMPEEYAERIKDDYYEDNPACFHEGLCAMVAEGADGNSYLEVFDADWNLQFDPMKVTVGWWDYAYYSEGLLTARPIVEDGDGASVVRDTVAYDEKGNEVLAFEGCVSPLVDGVFLHADPIFSDRTQQYVTSRVIDYLDKSGQPLFDQIDSSEAKILDINVED